MKTQVTQRILSIILAVSLVSSLQLAAVPFALATEGATALTTESAESAAPAESDSADPADPAESASAAQEVHVSTWAELAAAVEAAPEGATTTICIDAAHISEVKTSITIPAGKTIVLQAGNAETPVKLEADADGITQFFEVAEGASLTLGNNLSFSGNNTNAHIVLCYGELILDGAQLSSATGYAVRVTGENATFISNSGEIYACTIASGNLGAPLEILSGANATISDINIHDNSNRGSGSGGLYIRNAHVTMLDGTIANNATKASGGGVYVQGLMDMYGGTIVNNKADGDGGGVNVAYGGTFNFYGGTISNNRANEAGGGISVGGLRDYQKKSKLYMYNGIVDSNSSELAGGGIFVQAGSYGYIEAGYITNNVGRDSSSEYKYWYTGGGIYVNGGYTGSPWNVEDGRLDIARAYIVDNYSHEEGGGIANCPSSTLSIYLSNGLAVGQNYQFRMLREYPDDFWITSNDAGFNGETDHMGTPTIYVSSVMLGGAKNNWVYRNSDGVPFEHLDEEYTMPAETDIRLVNDVSSEDLARAATKATVFITGNYAMWGKGGGVGSNGILNFGIEYPEYGSLEVSKTVEDNFTSDTQDFTMRVTLDYKVSGTYGEMDFVDGVATFTLKNGETKTATNLIPDFSYTVEEIDAPAYDITYPLGNSGQVVGNTISSVNVVNKLKTTEVLVSKVILGQGEELAGAALSITGTDINGNEIEEITWQSSGKAESFTLPAGTYTLVENQAPLGYQIAESITFSIEVAEDGTLVLTIDGEEIANSTVVMFDKPWPTIEISKVDATTKAELPGATLIIAGADGKVVESWVSTDETHKVQLAPGTYVLTEITAPDGYEVAESITFTVDEDGLVGSEKVVMEDAPVVPEEPEEPEEPETPEEPEEPETPEEPEEPTEPETPEEPIVPEEPETPTQPEQPTTPEEPVKHKVTIIKVDDEGNPVAGVWFGMEKKLYGPDGALYIPVGPTDENGMAVLEDYLPEKEYIIYEVEAPEGYIMDETVYDVVFDENNTFTLKVVNKKKPEETIEVEEPETPLNPSTPEEPEQPTTPEEPAQPEQPATPSSPAKPSTPVAGPTPSATPRAVAGPITADAVSSLGLAGLAGLALVGAVGVFVSRRKKRD